MRIGQFKQRIVIERATQAKNAIGELVPTWATFVTVWAAVEPATGNTYYAAKQADSKADGRIRIRYRNDIKPTMRVKFDGRYLAILSVINPQESKKETHLIYTENLD